MPIPATNPEQIIQHTETWVKEVVIGCQFCPFAYKVVVEKKIRFIVVEDTYADPILKALVNELQYLDTHPETETTLLILPAAFTDFATYLSFTDRAEKTLRKYRYEGIYQLATFHPQYCFAGSHEDDAANYTNRSPYPMLHVLREDSLEEALAHFPSPESIPERNIRFAHEKGLLYMQHLMASCMR
jgi:hypothetical protein